MPSQIPASEALLVPQFYMGQSESRAVLPALPALPANAILLRIRGDIAEECMTYFPGHGVEPGENRFRSRCVRDRCWRGAQKGAESESVPPLRAQPWPQTLRARSLTAWICSS